MPAHKAKAVVVIFGVADSRNRPLCAHLFCKEAGKHILLVGIHSGDVYVNAVYSGFGKGIVIGGVAIYAHNVVYICDILDNASVVIHRDNIVSFGDQRGKYGGADFSAAGDNDIHNKTIL